MHYLEKLHNLFLRGRGLAGSQAGLIESQPTPKSICFHDLRDENEAQRRGVEPGHYLSVSPVSESEFQNQNLIVELSPFFQKKLIEEDFHQRSGTRIPFNTKGDWVDPAQLCQFSAAGYIPEKELLIVRVDRVYQDEAQKVAITAIRDKTAEIRRTDSG